MSRTAPRRAAARWSAVVIVAFALTAVGLLAAPSVAFAWGSNAFSSADESELVSLTNQARASAGLPALKVDSTLRSIARWRSKDMSDRNYFSHDIPNPPGGKVFNEMDREGYCYHVAGENIGWNTYPDATATAEIQSAFMNSSPHRANILGASWDHIGIGAYKEASGKKFWTVLFADTCGSAPKPTPRPTPKATPKPTPRPTSKATPKPTPEVVASPSDGATESPTDSLEPSPTDLATEPPTDEPSAEPTGGIAIGSPGGQTFRVTDPPVPQGLFETIVGGVAGFFFGS